MVRVKVRHPASVPARVGLFLILLLMVFVTQPLASLPRPSLVAQNSLHLYAENNGYYLLYKALYLTLSQGDLYNVVFLNRVMILYHCGKLNDKDVCDILEQMKQ